MCLGDKNKKNIFSFSKISLFTVVEDHRILHRHILAFSSFRHCIYWQKLVSGDIKYCYSN